MREVGFFEQNSLWLIITLLLLAAFAVDKCC